MRCHLCTIQVVWNERNTLSRQSSSLVIVRICLIFVVDLFVADLDVSDGMQEAGKVSVGDHGEAGDHARGELVQEVFRAQRRDGSGDQSRRSLGSLLLGADLLQLLLEVERDLGEVVLRNSTDEGHQVGASLQVILETRIWKRGF